MYKIKEMPTYSRPRERLIEHGANALATEELLAILLRTGSTEKSVVELAKSVLFHLNQIDDLRKISVEELCLVKGIKQAKAATVLAAIELGKRLFEYNRKPKDKINDSIDVYNFLKTNVTDLEQEHFICLYLNTKSEVIKAATVFIGTLNQTLIHPREIFKHAVRLSAAAIILVHNHPTGDATPSKADILITSQIEKAASLIGIDIVDHVIIGYNQYYSVKNQKKGYIK